MSPLIEMSNSSNCQFHRTKMCRYFQNSRCFKGDECTHAHTRAELVDKPDLRKTSLCHMWMKTSRCSLESTCPYAHGRSELKNAPSPRARQDSLNGSVAASSQPHSPVSYNSTSFEKRSSFPRRSYTTETRSSSGDHLGDENVTIEIRSTSPVSKLSSNYKTTADKRRRSVTLTPFHDDRPSVCPPSVYPSSLLAVSEFVGCWSPHYTPPFYYSSYTENVSMGADIGEEEDGTPRSLIEFPIIC